MNSLRFLLTKTHVARTVALGGAVLLYPGHGPGHNTPVKPPAAPPSVATVVPADPVPNTEDPVSGAPLEGGIRYAWTVRLAGNTSATFEGATGAWGWDEDGESGTPLGRTEAATWVALDLKSPSRLTVRFERRPGAIDALSLFPGETAGGNLKPAFTIYRGWDNDGGDEAVFANRGEVAWAEDIAYLDHAEASATVAEGTFVLAAGLYTVVLGGNSDSLIPEPRQGYAARFTSVSLERVPKLTYPGGRNQVTTRPSLKLSGRVGAPGEITSLRIYHHGKTKVVRVKGSGAWTTKITALDWGTNTVWITPVSKYGTAFPPQRMKITRR